MLTAKELAWALYQELDRDNWGDVDPYWFKLAAEMPSNPNGRSDEFDEGQEEARALLAVLEQVAARLNQQL
ncbi:hypothetical protein C4588_02755 [Candidatus Parcubacteria bacterium]|nr:MAG: hypothetical protein C4588_02755 [Candidatus Parcubacteria bacterium]